MYVSVCVSLLHSYSMYASYSMYVSYSMYASYTVTYSMYISYSMYGRQISDKVRMNRRSVIITGFSEPPRVDPVRITRCCPMVVDPWWLHDSLWYLYTFCFFWPLEFPILGITSVIPWWGKSTWTCRICRDCGNVLIDPMRIVHHNSLYACRKRSQNLRTFAQAKNMFFKFPPECDQCGGVCVQPCMIYRSGHREPSWHRGTRIFPWPKLSSRTVGAMQGTCCGCWIFYGQDLHQLHDASSVLAVHERVQARINAHFHSCMLLPMGSLLQERSFSFCFFGFFFRFSRWCTFLLHQPVLSMSMSLRTSSPWGWPCQRSLQKSGGVPQECKRLVFHANSGPEGERGKTVCFWVLWTRQVRVATSLASSFCFMHGVRTPVS